MIKLKTPITWIGGKHHKAKKIIPYFPIHNTYVELFGGGASVLLQKSPSNIEVFNDINGDLINFFRVLRNKKKFKEFYDILNLIPYSRQEYYDSINSLQEGSDIEKSIKFFIIAKMSFGGKFGKGWGYNRISNNMIRVNAWLNTIKLLPEISERLKQVQIDNRDYKILMKYFNDPKIFIYADPPYLNSVTNNNGSYKIWSEDQHEDFLDKCLNSNSKIMISGYYSDLYIDKLKYWNRVKFNFPSYVPNKSNEKLDYIDEFIWMNYSKKKKCPKIKTLMDFQNF